MFWRRRIRISTIWRTSASRPITGSTRPCLARSVRLIVYWSSAGVWLGGPPRPAAGAPAAARSAVADPSSAEPATIFIRLAERDSTPILASSREASSAWRPSRPSDRIASRSTPERIFAAWNWIEAWIQASRMSCSIVGARAGVRALPVLKRSIARVRSRRRCEVSTS